MANNEALLDLQTRLNSRLQDARDQPRESGWLAVVCADVGLILPLPEAGEIISARELMPLPHTKPWVAGVTNLRAHVHVVIDLAAFLHLRGPATGRPDGVGRATSHLVLLNPSLNLGAALCVDRLAGLKEAAELQPIAEDAAARPAFAKGLWRDAEGRQWQGVDLSALARDARFLDIAA